MSELMHIRPRGGMVDTRDLKSLGLVGRAGSSPAAGTTCWVIFPSGHFSFGKRDVKRSKSEHCFLIAIRSR